MRKHINMSYVKIFSLIFTSFFEVLFLIALIVCFIIDSTMELKIAFSIFVSSLIVFHYILIELIYYLFRKVGKNRILISHNVIKVKDLEIIIDEDVRIIYSPINLENFLRACPGELVVIRNGDGIKLGWFTGREIKKMKKFIPNIKKESKLSLK